MFTEKWISIQNIPSSYTQKAQLKILKGEKTFLVDVINMNHVPEWWNQWSKMHLKSQWMFNLIVIVIIYHLLAISPISSKYLIIKCHLIGGKIDSIVCFGRTSTIRQHFKFTDITIFQISSW